MRIKIYVEGGGSHGQILKTKCRQGFNTFLRKAGLEGRMPRIVASGGRQSAYDDFCTALRKAEDGEFIVLLVDSEDPIQQHKKPWAHLEQRDGWSQPAGANDDNVHLMVQCMEAWFFADVGVLQSYYGPHFNSNALPKRQDVENILKADLYTALEKATKSKDITKGEYGKGKHSFDILSELDPNKVKAASPFAERLIRVLLEKA